MNCNNCNIINGCKELRVIPTTFGLFFEWFIGWRDHHSTFMEISDVNEEMLKEYFGCYVDGTFEDEDRKFDIFFGIWPNDTIFRDNYTWVADFIKDNFYRPIALTEYSDGKTPCVKFNVGRVAFDMSIGLCFGEYEYEVDSDGFRI